MGVAGVLDQRLVEKILGKDVDTRRYQRNAGLAGYAVGILGFLGEMSDVHVFVDRHHAERTCLGHRNLDAADGNIGAVCT